MKKEKIKLVKIFEWSMAHRMPAHEVDRNLHGHRYKLEVEVEGSVQKKTGVIMDLIDLKNLIQQNVIDLLNHSCAYCDSDKVMEEFYKRNPDLQSLKMDCLPTVENLLKWIKLKANPLLDQHFKDIKITRLQLWESDSSYAILVL